MHHCIICGWDMRPWIKFLWQWVGIFFIGNLTNLLCHLSDPARTFFQPNLFFRFPTDTNSCLIISVDNKGSSWYHGMTKATMIIWAFCVSCLTWCHQMETLSALLAICAGNSPVSIEFPAQRPVTRSFDIFFDLPPNNGWVNNREAGDLRRYRAHYDVTVMRRVTYK